MVEPMDKIKARYLHLLKYTLTRRLFPESFDRIPPNRKTLVKSVRTAVYEAVNGVLGKAGMALVHGRRATGETMLDIERLDNIEFCISDVVAKGIPGDVIETGVWRGGGTIFMKAVLEACGDSTRTVWVADSFEGLPKPNEKDYPADAGDTFWMQTLGVSEAEVRANFERYGLLDDRVKFLKGFFSDTMPTAPIGQLSVLRLDGDMYESTYVVLKHLYDKVSVGGYIIVDDYGCVPACAQATEDFRAERGITDPIIKVDWTGVYWQKSA
jgi:O-methyltransferase